IVHANSPTESQTSTAAESTDHEKYAECFLCIRLECPRQGDAETSVPRTRQVAYRHGYVFPPRVRAKGSDICLYPLARVCGTPDRHLALGIAHVIHAVDRNTGGTRTERGDKSIEHRRARGSGRRQLFEKYSGTQDLVPLEVLPFLYSGIGRRRGLKKSAFGAKRRVRGQERKKRKQRAHAKSDGGRKEKTCAIKAPNASSCPLR